MILVTGAAEYIGSHICYKLKNKSFIAIDNLPNNQKLKKILNVKIKNNLNNIIFSSINRFNSV